MQHLVSTPLDKCNNFVLCKNPADAVKKIKMKVFGTESIDNLDPNNLTLPRMAVRAMDNKKVKSLQKKYRTIPSDKLGYFPDPVADSDDEEEAEPVAPVAGAAAPAAAAAAPKRKKEPVAPGARKKPGPKPKNALPLDAGSKSIMMFFGKA